MEAQQANLNDVVRVLVGHKAAGNLGSGLGWYNGLDSHPLEAPINAHHIQGGSQPPEQHADSREACSMQATALPVMLVPPSGRANIQLCFMFRQASSADIQTKAGMTGRPTDRKTGRQT